MGTFIGELYAESLRMTTQVRVILPDLSNDVTPVESGEPRVLYLLHGLSANSGEWTRFSKIEYYAKKYNFIVIMPEAQRSFYCDTQGGIRYFQYVADELPDLCDRWFRLTSQRDRTFIAGESMGGYGAVKIGLSRPQRFGGIASLSGVLDYKALAGRAVSGEWSEIGLHELQALHGPSGLPGREEDVVELVRRMAHDPQRPRLIQLCGTEDFLYEDNQRFRIVAEEAGYGHIYREEPGDHEWPYWDKAIQHALQFFCGLDFDRTPLY